MLLSLTGCVNDATLAPVSRLPFVQRSPGPYYRVQRGDTLYSIAWAYQMDYRQLAAMNHLGKHYRIWPGQRLRTRGQIQSIHKAKTSPLLAHRLSHWRKPAQGRVVEGFTSGLAGNPGINIAGYLNEPVIASQGGRVVYSGAGLRAYGNLIIIKHNDSYLSAYAFNQKNLVHVGQVVKQGQQIASMGRNNAGDPVLHFEIRRDGKPVNPASYVG